MDSNRFAQASALLLAYAAADDATRPSIAEKLSRLPLKTGWIDGAGEWGFLSCPELSSISDGRLSSDVALDERLPDGSRLSVVPLSLMRAGAPGKAVIFGRAELRVSDGRAFPGGLLDRTGVLAVMAAAGGNHRVYYISDNVRDYGYSPSDFYGGTLGWLDAVSPCDRERFASEVERLCRVCSRFSYRFGLTGGGRERAVLADISVGREPDGTPLFYEAAVIDISAEAEAEAELSRRKLEASDRLRFLVGDSGRDIFTNSLSEIFDMDMLFGQLSGLARRLDIFLALWDTDGRLLFSEVPSAVANMPEKRAFAESDNAFGRALPSAGNVAARIGRGFCPVTGLPVAAEPLYIRHKLMARCVFGYVPVRPVDFGALRRRCSEGGYPADEIAALLEKLPVRAPEEFDGVCKIVGLALDGVSSYGTLSVDLMQQINETQMCRERVNQEQVGQTLINRMISSFYNSPGMDEIVGNILELVGKTLGFSRAYLYETAKAAKYAVTHEWVAGSVRPLPGPARLLQGDHMLLPYGYTSGCSVLEDGSLEFLRRTGALCAVHLPVYDRQSLCGVVGVDDCLHARVWTDTEIKFLTSVLRVVGGALLWKNTRRNAGYYTEALGSMLENINAMVYVSDVNTHRLLFANELLFSSLRVSSRSLGQTCWQVMRPDAREPCPWCVQKDIGSAPTVQELSIGGRWYRSTSSRITWVDGRPAMLVSLYDISDVKQKELQIEYSAYHDALLGIFNRRRFESDIKTALGGGQPGALFMFDIDDFKYINDAYGHDMGDAALGRFVRAMRPIFGQAFYRVGGDEFMALQTGGSAAQIQAIVGRISSALSKESENAPDGINISASVGIARFPQDGNTPHDIIRSADMAMYMAKRMGKGRVIYFGRIDEPLSDSSTLLENALRAEIAAGMPNMRLVYQPIAERATGRIAGAEVLLRWNNEAVRSAREFVMLAERAGLVPELGRFILRAAVNDMASHGSGIWLSVNLFDRQVQDEALSATVGEILKSRGCDPGRLVLEVSETLSQYDRSRKVSQLAALREFGVRICADNYGEGPSSPGSLRSENWDMIKLGRQFVGRMDMDHFIFTMVRGWVTLAQAAGKTVCAGGVETTEQRALLSSYGCDYLQGNFLCPPVEAAEFWEMAESGVEL